MAQTSSPAPVEHDTKITTRPTVVQNFHRWMARAEVLVRLDKSKKKSSCSSGTSEAISLPETVFTEPDQQDISRDKTSAHDKTATVPLETEKEDLEEAGNIGEEGNRLLTAISDPDLTSGVFVGGGLVEGLYSRTDDPTRKIRRLGIRELRKLHFEREEKAVEFEKFLKKAAMERLARQVWEEYYEEEWGGGFENVKGTIIERLAALEAAARETSLDDHVDDDDDVEVPARGIVRPVGLARLSISETQGRMEVGNEEVGSGSGEDKVETVIS